MLLQLDHPKLFSDMVGIISELVLEVRMKVSSEGMSIMAIDPANVAMIMFKLPASAFSTLEVQQEEVLGVSLESLKAVLRRIKTSSALVMRREENELHLEIKDKITKEFRLALIEIEGEEKKEPSLDFIAKIEMPSVDFAETIEDCTVVADSCSFIAKPDGFTIQAKGSLNSFKSEFPGDALNIQAEEAHSRYSLEYLQKMIKPTKMTDTVKINFGKDYPLRLEYETPFVQLRFILAPRVETED